MIGQKITLKLPPYVEGGGKGKYDGHMAVVVEHKGHGDYLVQVMNEPEEHGPQSYLVTEREILGSLR